MYVVGLIGPMGTGKSVVLELLRELGAECLRADDASRELLSKDMRLVSRVAERLGSDLVRGDGSLDRARTAALIFDSPDARVQLEQIVHPPMLAWLRDHIDELRGRDHEPQVAVVEAANLTQIGARELVDAVVRLEAPLNVCAERVQARDGVSLQQAMARLELHRRLGLFTEPADHVLDTSGTMQQTHCRTRRLWQELLAQALQVSDEA